MSTHMYLRCVTHDPYISSDEVGHHTGDLSEIRKDLRERDVLVEPFVSGRLSLWDYVPISSAEKSRLHFLVAHPHCDLEIWDEYRREYSIEDTADEKLISTDTPLGKVKMVIENEEGVIIHFGELTPEGKRVVNRMMQT